MKNLNAIPGVGQTDNKSRHVARILDDPKCSRQIGLSSCDTLDFGGKLQCSGLSAGTARRVDDILDGPVFLEPVPVQIIKNTLNRLNTFRVPLPDDLPLVEEKEGEEAKKLLESAHTGKGSLVDSTE